MVTGSLLRAADGVGECLGKVGQHHADQLHNVVLIWKTLFKFLHVRTFVELDFLCTSSRTWLENTA